MTNWDAIGAIGEVVGALAVVISFMYVAVQVKQSNRQAASDSGFALLSEFSRVDELILTTPEMIALMVKLESEEDLTKEERKRSEHFGFRLINNWMAADIAHQNGLLDADMYDDMIADARYNITTYPQLKNILVKLFENYPGIRKMNIFRVALDGE